MDAPTGAASLLEKRDSKVGGLDGVRSKLAGDEKLAFDSLIARARARMPKRVDNTAAFAARYPDAGRIKVLG